MLSQELMGEKWGLGMLVPSQIAPGTEPPSINEMLKGRLLTCEIRLSHEWNLVTVSVCYGASIMVERKVIKEQVSKILHRPY